MNCELARTLLFCRACDGPRGLTHADVDALSAHMASCPECSQASSGPATAFDAAIGSAIRDVPVPLTAKMKLGRVVAARAASRMYRTWALRAAVVAVAAIGGGLGYGVHRASRPPFDPGALVWQVDRERVDPEWAVHAWLADEGMPETLPADFKMAFCTSYGKVPVQGQDVPSIEFRYFDPQSGGEEIARLFILSDAQFKFADLSPGRSSYFTSQLLHDDRDNSGYVYVVLYTTPTLDPFLNSVGRFS